MAKYLRPRRGSKDSAFAQKILLKKGEVFLEFPNSEIGRGPGRLVVGDGATSYQNMNYTSTATNVFRPFITDPELYVPRFENSTYATSGWTVDAGTEAINAMGDGSSASTVALPTFLGLVKNALCKHTNSIVKINNDLADKADKTIFSISAEGLVPKPTNATTANFLKGDGTWAAPNNTTYDVVSTTANGLAPKLPTANPAEKYLDGNGSFSFIPNAQYNSATATDNHRGLVTVNQLAKLNSINTRLAVPTVNFTDSGSTRWYHPGGENPIYVYKPGLYLLVGTIKTHIKNEGAGDGSGIAPITNGTYGDVRVAFGHYTNAEVPEDDSTVIKFQYPITNYDQKNTFAIRVFAVTENPDPDQVPVGESLYMYGNVTYGPDGTSNPTEVIISATLINMTAIEPYYEPSSNS